MPSLLKSAASIPLLAVGIATASTATFATASIGTAVKPLAGGQIVSITGPRAITWSSYLGVNTDFTDLTNPIVGETCPNAALTIAQVKQEIASLHALGLNWIREPVRWTLELTRNVSTRAGVSFPCLAASGNGLVPSFDSNITAVYNALQSSSPAVNIDYYVSGAPCWAESGPSWTVSDSKGTQCAYLTGTQTGTMPDTIGPMSDLADYTTLFQHLVQIVPNAQVLETWDEENSSAFWAHQTSIYPTGYNALQMASDFNSLNNAAIAGAGGKTVSAGGFAYYGDMNGMTAVGPPANTGYSGYNTGGGGFPVDLRNCTSTQTGACYPTNITAYPDPLNAARLYSYHLLNGLAQYWASSPPQIAQFHPYQDYEPANNGYTDNWLLQNSMHTTAQLRGQEGVHNDSFNYDTGSQYFTSLQVPSVWAGEFGISVETYANGKSASTACTGSTTLQACGERYQALYTIRQLAMMSALDFDRVMLFALSDVPDANYLTASDTGARDSHYGLLHTDGSVKPVYAALKRFLTLAGPSLTPGVAVGDTGGLGISITSMTETSSNTAASNLFCVSWVRSDGKHLLMFWTPDATATLKITGLAAGAHATLHTILAATDTALTADASGNLNNVPSNGADSLPTSGTKTIPAGDVQILEY